MKRAVIFSIPTTTSIGYCWRWRSADGKTDSTGSFAYYYDCLENARASGYDVQPTGVCGQNAPGRGAVTPQTGM
jgi:hypothetical protein